MHWFSSWILRSCQQPRVTPGRSVQWTSLFLINFKDTVIFSISGESDIEVWFIFILLLGKREAVVFISTNDNSSILLVHVALSDIARLLFGFSELCFVQFYKSSPCCSLSRRMNSFYRPTNWLSHTCAVINGGPVMGTSGSGKSLLQRRVLLQEAGRQQKSRSNRGMRYLGSTSSILIGPEEQAGDSQVEGWGILALPRLYASAVYKKQEADAVSKVYLIYCHQPR